MKISKGPEKGEGWKYSTLTPIDGRRYWRPETFPRGGVWHRWQVEAHGDIRSRETVLLLGVWVVHRETSDCGALQVREDGMSVKARRGNAEGSIRMQRPAIAEFKCVVRTKNTLGKHLGGRVEVEVKVKVKVKEKEGDE